MIEKPIKRTRGILIRTLNGEFVFRIYSEDKETFKDYQIRHDDLEIEIIDDGDASFYEYEVEEREDYDGFIDYPSQALGRIPKQL